MLKPYGNIYVAAPHIEKLANESLIFTNAFVQQAVCGPSRNSFMTGRRPDSTQSWNFQASFRQVGVDESGALGADWTSLPEAFKNNGYLTLGAGKLYHPNDPASNDCLNPHPSDATASDCLSWSTVFSTSAPANITLNGSTVTACDGAGACTSSEAAAECEAVVHRGRRRRPCAGSDADAD